MRLAFACLLTIDVAVSAMQCDGSRRGAGTPGPSGPSTMAKPAAAAAPSAVEVEASPAATIGSAAPVSLVEKLREISRRLGSNLTVIDLGRLMGQDFDDAGGGFWAVTLEDGSTLLAKAKAESAAVTWLKFRTSSASGLTFSEAEQIYGTNHSIREGQKDGTDIHYSPGAASSVSARTYVGLRLWNRGVTPSAPVTQITLSAPPQDEPAP